MRKTTIPDRIISLFRVMPSGATLLATLTLVLFSPSARAIDGGLGRSISGAQITPYQAVVPPEPGVFFASIGAVYYPASIDEQKMIPYGGRLLADIDADITLVSLTLAYDWPGVAAKWNVLSAIVVPWAAVSLDAKVSTNRTMPSTRAHDSNSGLYDIMLRIAQASYHIDAVRHVSIAFDLWTPTGSYEPTRLANLGLDNWTYVATLSYTHILPAHNIELSSLWAVEYYTPNRSTNYHSGMMSRVEALAVKRFPFGLGVGLVASWMAQLTPDTGPLADRFDGFEGHAYGIGPIVTWTGKAGPMMLSVSARWVHEFDNKNLLQGEVVSVSVGTQF